MKKKTIIIIGIVIVIVIVLAVLGNRNKGPEYVTYTVDQGGVMQTVDVTGEVSSTEDIGLNFKTTGKLAVINVRAGDRIIKNQTLATLDIGALQSRVDDANGDLLEMRANLEKVLAGATEEDIRISEINVEQKKQDLVAAQIDLNNLKSSRDTELKNLKNTVVVNIDNEIITAKNSLEIANNTLNNDEARNTLGILDAKSVDQAKNSYDLAVLLVEATKKAIAGVNEDSLDVEIEVAMSEVKNALDKTREALSDTFEVLENTIISNELTQAELDALISDINTEQSNISTAKTNLQTSYANWTNKQVYYDDQISKQENTVKAAEDTVELAGAELALKIAGPQDYEIKTAQAKITKAQASLSLALANLRDAIITAPVNGTVVKVNNKIGEQTSLATAVIEMIGESNLEIEVDIPESDIAKIETGQEAEITLDSFGDDEVFLGTVTFIDPAETVIQDVVYYQVKVQFNSEIVNIKPGMTANIMIKTEVREGVRRVPLRAVKSKNGDKIVEILVNNKEIEERKVEVGLRGDEFMEIVSGLEAGEEVITFVKNGS